MTLGRRIGDLDARAVETLPEPCRACVFWETRRGQRGPAADPEAGRLGKEAWWQATQLEWAVPGKAVVIDGALVAYATFAPPAHFPRARLLGGNVSDDALLLAALWVDPAWRGGGLARQLLQAVMREAHRGGAGGLEAFGVRGESTKPCLLPEAFLLANGFAVLQDHHSYPLLRIDMRRAVPWHQTVGRAVEAALSSLGRREQAPIPSRAQRVRMGTGQRP